MILIRLWLDLASYISALQEPTSPVCLSFSAFHAPTSIQSFFQPLSRGAPGFLIVPALLLWGSQHSLAAKTTN